MKINKVMQALGITRQELINYVGQGIITYKEVPDNDGTIHTHIEYSDIDIKLLLEIMEEQAERRHRLIEMIMPPAPSEEDGMDELTEMIEELGSAINSTQIMIVNLQASTMERDQSVYAVLQTSRRIERAAQNALNTIESIMGREQAVDEKENGKIRAREKALHMILQDALPEFQSQISVVLSGGEKKTKRAADAWTDIKSWYEVVRSGVLVEIKKEEETKDEEEKEEDERTK